MSEYGRADNPRRWTSNGLLAVVVALFASYIGAYYATYTMPRGIMVGTTPHYQYRIGSKILPPSEAYYFFYPAHLLDRQIRPHEVDE
jgi:hypothetical protein